MGMSVVNFINLQSLYKRICSKFSKLIVKILKGLKSQTFGRPRVLGRW